MHTKAPTQSEIVASLPLHLQPLRSTTFPPSMK